MLNNHTFIYAAALLTGGALAVIFLALIVFYVRLRDSFRKRTEELSEITSNLESEMRMRRKSEQDIAEQELRLRQMAESLPVGFLITDEQGFFTFANAPAARLFRTSREAIVGHHAFHDTPQWKAYGPDGQLLDFAENPFSRVLSTRLPVVEVEQLIEWPSGESVHLLINAAPVFSASGTLQRVVASVQDISRRKETEERMRRSLEEKVLLLKEVHHRVKNNMQLMKSMLNLMASHVEDAKSREVLREGVNRISAMALVHEKLYSSKRFGSVNIREYLSHLADSLRQTYPHPELDIEIRTQIESVIIDIDSAVPCGLIANELISNALKHAFHGRTSGLIELVFRRIALSSQRASSGSKPCFELIVKDDGVGIPEPIRWDHVESLGLTLVDSLVGQLEGSIDVTSSREAGTTVRIDFPRRAEAGSASGDR